MRGQSSGSGVGQAFCFVLPLPPPPTLPVLISSSYLVYKTFLGSLPLFSSAQPLVLQGEKAVVTLRAPKTLSLSRLVSFHSLQLYMENVDSFKSGSITLSALRASPQRTPQLASHWLPGALQDSVIQGIFTSLSITVALGFCADSLCFLLGTLQRPRVFIYYNFEFFYLSSEASGYEQL